MNHWRHQVGEDPRQALFPVSYGADVGRHLAILFARSLATIEPPGRRSNGLIRARALVPDDVAEKLPAGAPALA